MAFTLPFVIDPMACAMFQPHQRLLALFPSDLFPSPQLPYTYKQHNS